MNKCKYCNSENLILEPRVQGQDVMTADMVALKCGDCGKWLKWCPKDERKYHLKQNNKKFYIEISDWESPCEYMFQSEWFDTEEQALEWAKNIAFLNKQYLIKIFR